MGDAEKDSTEKSVAIIGFRGAIIGAVIGVIGTIIAPIITSIIAPVVVTGIDIERAVEQTVTIMTPKN